MAAFMIYGVLITALLLVACHLGEKCLVTFGLPTRVVWLIGLSLSISLLAFGMAGKTQNSVSANGYQGAVRVVAVNSPLTLAPTPTLPPTLLESLLAGLKRFDGALLWLWMTGTALTLVGLVLLTIRVRRMVALADNAQMGGVPVLVTDRVGPALVGILKYEIIVPRWALGLSEEQQSLIIAHEQQHARTFDPVLVWVVALAILALPWNVSLWYLIRRLRTSIELDCDRRVLERSSNAHLYASLLIAVGAKVSSRPFFAAALSESASQLERRILAMSSTGQSLPRLRPLASSLAIVLVLGAAFRAPRPELPVPTVGQRAEAMLGSLAVDGPTGVVAGKRSMATVSIESQSKAAVPLLVFTTKSARIVANDLSVRITSDTLRLRTPTSLTADLTDGEVHLVSVDGSVLDVTVVYHDSPATHATAEWSHVILIQGGTGVASGKTLGPPRVSREKIVVAGPGTELFSEFQVETRAAEIPAAFPQYPDALRAAGIEGQVKGQFVVNVDGKVDVGTFQLLGSASSSANHMPRRPDVEAFSLFANAVRDVLPKLRYSPAEVGGRPVRQLVQQTFQFKLDRRPISDPPLVRVDRDGVADRVAAMARRFEPTVFDKKVTPGSSVVGLLIDENGAVIHHSSISVLGGTENLRMLMPRLFPNMQQANKAPYSVMSLVDGAFAGRSVQAVAVFLRRPEYASKDR